MQTTLSLIGSQLAVATRTLVALVFLAAALGKMRHWLAFQGVLANYRLLPERLIAPVAYLLPPAEAALALWLATGFATASASLAAASLLLLFAAAMGINLLRGRRSIDCGCFQSTLKQSLSWRLVVRNVAIASFAVIAALAPPVSGDLWQTFQAVLAGTLLFVLLNTLNILWSIVPAWRRTSAGGAGVASSAHVGGQA